MVSVTDCSHPKCIFKISLYQTASLRNQPQSHCSPLSEQLTVMCVDVEGNACTEVAYDFHVPEPERHGGHGTARLAGRDDLRHQHLQTL